LQKAFKVVYNDSGQIQTLKCYGSLEYPYMFVLTCFNDLFSFSRCHFGDKTHENTQTLKSTTSFKTFSASLHYHTRLIS